MASRKLKIAMTGTFDVLNCGDLLFPLLAEKELRERLGDVDVLKFSYHPKSPPSWPYQVYSVQALPGLLGEIEGLIVGGGHLLGIDKEVALGYGPSSPGIHHPTGYWLAPAFLAANALKPVAWNAVSASPDTPSWAMPLLAAVLRASDYVAVRDRSSLNELKRVVPGVDIRLVPDSVFGLPALVSPERPSEAFLRWRESTGLTGDYVVVQASRAFNRELSAEIEKGLRAVIAEGYRVLEVPIGPFLGDEVGALGMEIAGMIRLRNWKDPLLVAEIMANSSAVVARSLHLSISALTFGVPVFRDGCPAGTKYEMLSHFKDVHTIEPGKFSEQLQIHIGRKGPSGDVLEQVLHLKNHWDSLAKVLTDHGSDASSDKRVALGAFCFGLPKELEAAHERKEETLLRGRDARIEQLEKQLANVETTLNNIYDSRGWKLLLKYYKARDKIFPPDTKRRLFAKLVVNFIMKPKQYVINRNTFRDIWKHVSGEERSASGRNVFLAREGEQKRRVMLFIDRHVPTYDKDAGSFVAYEYLKIFSCMGFKIIFWPASLHKMEPYTTELQQIGIEVIYGRQNFKRYIKRNGKYLDVACISRPHIAIDYIDAIRGNSNAKIIYIPYDLNFLREQRRAEFEKNPQLLEEIQYWKEKEFYLMENSNMTFIFSDAERRIIEKENADINVTVSPWVQPLNGTQKSFEEKRDLIFIGGFAHTPNEDAVLWFADEVFPLIKKEIPDVRFIIVGSDPTPRVSGLRSDNIIVTGYVRDVSPHFHGARVFVAPLRYGAGLKGKIILAMSYGLPIVTTSIGAEGLNLKDGENASIADEPEVFARRVVELYNDKVIWGKFSHNSLEYVKENNTIEAAERKFEELFKRINSMPKEKVLKKYLQKSGRGHKMATSIS